MADTAAFPYETRLNILHGPLEIIDTNVEDAKNYKWFNQTLCKVNHSVVRVGIIRQRRRVLLHRRRPAAHRP